MNNRSLFSIVIIILFLTLGVSGAYSDSLDKIQIIKISARDKQSIVKMDDGKMRIIRLGEEIIIKPDEAISPEAKGPSAKPDQQTNLQKKGSSLIRKAKVVEITADKIVLEEATKDVTETIIMSLVRQASADNKNRDLKTQKQAPALETKTEIYRIKKQPQTQNVPMQPNQNAKGVEGTKDKNPVSNIQNQDIKK